MMMVLMKAVTKTPRDTCHAAVELTASPLPDHKQMPAPFSYTNTQLHSCLSFTAKTAKAHYLLVHTLDM